MIRIWAKLFKNNHLLKDIVITNNSDDTRTRKIFQALSDVCYEFDLENPVWLDSNINEFKRISKTRFTKDSFIEDVDFDFLEFHVIEED